MKKRCLTSLAEKESKKALRIVKGEEFLVNTTLHSDYHNMLEMYDRLERKKQAALVA